MRVCIWNIKHTQTLDFFGVLRILLCVRVLGRGAQFVLLSAFAVAAFSAQHCISDGIVYWYVSEVQESDSALVVE
jgi:hypothetical protein